MKLSQSESLVLRFSGVSIEPRWAGIVARSYQVLFRPQVSDGVYCCPYCMGTRRWRKFDPPRDLQLRLMTQSESIRKKAGANPIQGLNDRISSVTPGNIMEGSVRRDGVSICLRHFGMWTRRPKTSPGSGGLPMPWLTRTDCLYPPILGEWINVYICMYNYKFKKNINKNNQNNNDNNDHENNNDNNVHCQYCKRDSYSYQLSILISIIVSLSSIDDQ